MDEEYGWKKPKLTIEKQLNLLNQRREQLLHSIEVSSSKKIVKEWILLQTERDKLLQDQIAKENKQLLEVSFLNLLEVLKGIGKFEHDSTPKSLTNALQVLYWQLKDYCKDFEHSFQTKSSLIISNTNNLLDSKNINTNVERQEIDTTESQKTDTIDRKEIDTTTEIGEFDTTTESQAIDTTEIKHIKPDLLTFVHSEKDITANTSTPLRSQSSHVYLTSSEWETAEGTSISDEETTSFKSIYTDSPSMVNLSLTDDSFINLTTPISNPSSSSSRSHFVESTPAPKQRHSHPQNKPATHLTYCNSQSKETIKGPARTSNTSVVDCESVNSGDVNKQFTLSEEYTVLETPIKPRKLYHLVKPDDMVAAACQQKFENLHQIYNTPPKDDCPYSKEESLSISID